MKHKICMIVQQPDVKGGIAAVTNGYYGSTLENDYDITYVESYCDGSAIKKILKALRAYIQFYKVLKTFKPELVHMHTSFGPSFYRLQPFLYMAKKKRIPVIDHCHGADFDTFYINASNTKKARVKKVFNEFSKIIVLSDEWKTRFRQIVPVEKIEVIENYCKLQPKERILCAIDRRFDNKQVLFLGELGRRKGCYDFGDIVGKLSQEMPDVSFCFCGDGTPEDFRNILENIKKNVPEAEVSVRNDKKDGFRGDIASMSKKKRTSRIFFPGWVRGNNKDEILDNSSLFLLPSYQEGLPMSVLDAMAYGLPIVSTNVGGIPQLIKNGKSGFICNAGDSYNMAMSIKKLLSDKEFYKKASIESFNIASERYSFETHIKRLSKVYHDVLYDHL